MESNANNTAKWKQVALIGVLALAAIGILVVKLGTKNSALAQEPQMTFQSPAEAGATLAKAAKTADEETLAHILGMETKTLLGTGGEEADKAAMEAFAAKYAKMNRWVDMTDGSRVLYVGADNFAFPVPLAKNSSGQWYFDAVAGAQEVRARDIGRNELLAIDACAAIANAQEIYFASLGVSPEYTQRIISSSGKQDGLYWPASDTQDASPLGSFSEFPKSSLGSNPPQKPFVIDGYTLRILAAQGDEAPGGAKSYVVNGKMTGGFAILATPVQYAQTGLMTFIAGRDGIVYERDLGPDTATLAASIQQYNPDQNWTPVE